jgi:ABC-type transporter Mla subunit MlaD
MTGEEMERAIEFLIQSQAKHEARLGELTQNVNNLVQRDGETRKLLEIQAETLNQFMDVALQNVKSQRQINEDLRRGQEDLRRGQEEVRAALRELAAAQRETDERFKQTDERLRQTNENLNQLAETVRRYVEGRT